MNSDPSAAEVRSLAVLAGFDTCGIAALHPVNRSDADYGRRWIAKGAHGTMQWMERTLDKRLDPSQVIQEPRSIVCVGMSYSDPEDTESSALTTGMVAKYARGRDYHKIFSKRLKHLEALLQDRFPGTESRRYVDTGPVMEKLWAEKAGLGWRGKHTNLVSRDFGSWLLLGEILLSVELTPDEAEKDHCGTCRNCIDVCPTRAITGPYQLDARLCISYLTIEHRGSIPTDLRPLMGNHIFGCDLCLDVCPWNKFSSAYTDRDFEPRASTTVPVLAELATLTPEEFHRRFAGTPVMRAKREGLVRNVCIALGNSGDPEAVEPLTLALKDPSPVVREHAVWALDRILGSE